MRPDSLPGSAALACIGLLMAACTSDSPGPTQPNLAATVLTTTEVVESDFTLNPRGCAPELVAFHFRTAFRFQQVFANDRRLIEITQAVERGSYGIGVQTGTMYRLAGGDHEVFSTGENGTATAVIFQRYTTQGRAANFDARIQVHFTMTPDGDIISEIERIDTEC